MLPIASTEVAVVVQGDCTDPPGPPSGLFAAVADTSIVLTWQAPAAGCAPAFHLIAAGSAPGLSNLASNAIGNGTYYVRVRSGHQTTPSAPSNEVSLTIGTPPCTTAPGTSGPSAELVVTVTGKPPSAPVITTHPTSRSTTADSRVTFTAAATGNPAPTVQWQVSTNGGASFSDLPGAASTTLSGTVGAADDGKQFRAKFSNQVNTAYTNPAILTVRVP